MKKLIITMIVLTGIGMNAFAADKSRKELNGDKYFFVYSFENAIDSYKSAKHLTQEGQRHMAESYHNLNQNTQAEEAYSKLLNTPEGLLADDYFNFAMVLKADGKYDEANIWMDKFKNQYPNDLRAKDYVAHNRDLEKLSKDDGKFKVNQLSINTAAEDFGPSYYKNQIVFTSSRSSKINPKKYKWNGKPFLNLYVSDLDRTELKSPSVLNKDFDGKMHDGPASFNKAGTFMAFTRNNYDLKRKDRVVNLEICFSTFTNGKWSKPEPFILNNKEYSVGHPCLSADGNTMYFTSDMPGGYGGADIYRITKGADGAWGKAENLGDKINTEGNEMFPFFEENNGVLFFASDGRFGLGGLDIFYCTADGSGFSPAINAGAPLNTKEDDFAIIADEKLSTGYFSSNRVGGKGDDDIYSVDINGLAIGKKIKGIAKDKDGNPVPKSFITLSDNDGTILDTLTTKDDGAYSFQVDVNKNFKLLGQKVEYTDGENTANTFGAALIVTADVTLLKKEKIVAAIVPTDPDLGVILKLNPVYFDLDKYNIRPDAATELDKIVKTMNANPDMIVEIRSYTDCRASEGYNDTLSQNRAKSTIAYIKKRISNPGRISGKGYGETNLLNSCDCDGDAAAACSEDEHQKNRRTEFIIKKK